MRKMREQMRKLSRMRRHHLLLMLSICGILLLGALLAFGLLSALHAVLPHLADFDAQVQAWVHGWTSPLLTALMLALTGLGGIATFATAAGVVTLLLIYRRRHHLAIVLGGSLTGALMLNGLLKLRFHRFRPDVPWRIGLEPTFSFPSGHALFATILYGTLAYLSFHAAMSVRRRVEVLAPALLLPISIGLSRIYLGMHFPTDVLAGYLAGLAWLAGLITADRVWQAQTAGDRPVHNRKARRVPARQLDERTQPFPPR
jgi:undecaprenyl-diphosphatase